MLCTSESIRPLTSIVSYPERGEGGNNKYRGNCSPKLIEDLIGFFKPSVICDYNVRQRYDRCCRRQMRHQQ